jgi:uncharacterized protein YbjT (DUF2867 family)
VQQRLENRPLILLTGATGYVGGRLVSRLLDSGFSVRCAARTPESLSHLQHQNAEIVKADLLQFESLESALTGVGVAFYLVHSLGSANDFEKNECLCAENFARAAKNAGVSRIIYLGGLGSGSELSPHLRTRQRVGKILRDSGTQTIEFRASIIIGSGSLSFEMVRALVDRLPIMITPRWVRAKAQPIAIEDVLDYLVAAIDLELDGSQVFEIGGPDVVSYMEIMRAYERRRGVHRIMIPVPLLTPRLSSLWLTLVTPLYARIGRKLVDSIQHDTLVEDQAALSKFSVRPRGFAEAIDRALANEDNEFAETRWSNALSAAAESPSWGGTRFGSRLVDSRTLKLKCDTTAAFSPIRTIGGSNGWYYANWAWSLRGFVDLLLGGVGVRRGRTCQENLHVGDVLDFWRVEAFEPNKLLRLRAEMKVPGRAWLQFEVNDNGAGSTIQQTALFDPLGVFGLLYWYCLFPVHALIFAGMLRKIGERATK